VCKRGALVGRRTVRVEDRSGDTTGTTCTRAALAPVSSNIAGATALELSAAAATTATDGGQAGDGAEADLSPELAEEKAAAGRPAARNNNSSSSSSGGERNGSARSAGGIGGGASSKDKAGAAAGGKKSALKKR